MAPVYGISGTDWHGETGMKKKLQIRLKQPRQQVPAGGMDAETSELKRL
jgi:hypothetical protein